MKCNYCGNPADWVENKEIYGINYGKSFMIWLCKPCNAFVGCHNNTKKPYGKYLANKELREARKKVHAIIDTIWKSGKITRKQLYSHLTIELGYNVHIGNTRTAEECTNIILAYNRLFINEETKINI